MDHKSYVKLGLNHHLLYADCSSNPADHQRTLFQLLQDQRLEVLDIWVPDVEPYRTNEIKAILDSGKDIYYNVGTRKGKEPAHPATLDPAKRKYSLAFYKDELDRAIAVDAKKVITNSGPDVPENRPAAFDALADFYSAICDYVPKDMLIMIEPTDREISKCKFIGPSKEAAALVQRIHQAGFKNFSSMVDMGHLPLMGESIEQAMEDSSGYIGHIHMGNCILNDKSHPMFGDKHVPWGIQGGQYDVDDVSELLCLGLKMGYFNSDIRGSASFEMRPYPGKTPEQSLDVYFDKFNLAWQQAMSDYKAEVLDD